MHGAPGLEERVNDPARHPVLQLHIKADMPVLGYVALHDLDDSPAAKDPGELAVDVGLLLGQGGLPDLLDHLVQDLLGGRAQGLRRQGPQLLPGQAGVCR